MPVIIKYAKGTYEKKVSNLEDYIRQLDTHLETLKTYRDQLGNYWKDAEGKRYWDLVNTEIRAVQNARTRSQNLRNVYNDASGELNKQHAVAADYLSEAESVINNLGIRDN